MVRLNIANSGSEHANDSSRKSVHSYGRRKVIKKPQRPKLWQNKQMSMLSRVDTADHWWFAYPFSLVAQTSIKREIFDAECTLAEIVEDVLEFLNPDEGDAAPRGSIIRAQELYQKTLHLKHSLPERLRAEDAVHPAAILLQ